MNLYMRAVGYRELTPEGEASLIKRAIDAAAKSGSFLKNSKYKRGLILFGTSEMAGIGVYGRIKGKKTFNYEYHFPYVIPSAKPVKADVVLIRNRTNEAFQAMIERSNIHNVQIFAVANPVDILDRLEQNPDLTAHEYELNGMSAIQRIYIGDCDISLTGYAISGMIILPARSNTSPKSNLKEGDNKNPAESADKEGKESEGNSFSEQNPNAGIAVRLRNESLLSIVETSLMPNGPECESYSIVGIIESVRTDKNILTDEEIYILELSANRYIIEIAINKLDLIGKPAKGRRFRGTIYVQGYIR